jgi:hypothetical protein
MINAASSAVQAHDAEAFERMTLICAWCGRPRSADGVWQETRDSVTDDKRVKFSHGICPHCFRDVSWFLARW